MGIGHALDADHIAAVSSLVSKHKNLKKAAYSGISWGLGHTTTLFIAGLLILLLKISIPKKIALSFEFVVAIMILILGISVIRDVVINKKHLHVHNHDGTNHFHIHSHKETNVHSHNHKSFFVGLIHGLAGSAGLMLLVLSTANSLTIGLSYILIFGIGSMIGMSIASSIISIPFVFTSNKLNKWNNRIRYATGIFSVMFGIFLMIKIGFFQGLFF